MFNWFNKDKRTVDTTKFTVEQLHDGRWGIVKRTKTSTLLVGDYTRKRDAFRGATRRGITVTT